MKAEKKPISIIKASGKIESFSPEKLKRSLIRSGAGAEHFQTILQKVEQFYIRVLPLRKFTSRHDKQPLNYKA